MKRYGVCAVAGAAALLAAPAIGLTQSDPFSTVRGGATPPPSAAVRAAYTGLNTAIAAEMVKASGA